MKISTSSGYLLGIFLQLCLISLVSSLSCYQCDSSEDIRCSEELTNRDLLRSLPCNTLSEPRYCVKMTGIFGADALKCYQCESENEYDCGEFFDSKHADVSMTECPLGNAQFCIKTTGIFSGNLGAKRFCSERFLDNYCTYVRRPGDQREYRSCVYTCTGDGCNSSVGLNPTKLIQLSALSLLIASAMTYHRL